MTPLEVYVETSVWSCAFAEDAPDHRRETLLFFNQCRRGAVTAVISELVLEETDRAAAPLVERLSNLLGDIAPREIDVSERATALADVFVEHAAVPPSKPEDALHVACAFAAELDVLVSWNFRHIASVRRAERFNALAVLNGYYKPLRIVSPAEVLYDDAT